jgi:hypothetical protein
MLTSRQMPSSNEKIDEFKGIYSKEGLKPFVYLMLTLWNKPFTKTKL